MGAGRQVPRCGSMCNTAGKPAKPTDPLEGPLILERRMVNSARLDSPSELLNYAANVDCFQEPLDT